MRVYGHAIEPSVKIPRQATYRSMQIDSKGRPVVVVIHIKVLTVDIEHVSLRVHTGEVLARRILKLVHWQFEQPRVALCGAIALPILGNQKMQRSSEGKFKYCRTRRLENASRQGVKGQTTGPLSEYVLDSSTQHRLGSPDPL